DSPVPKFTCKSVAFSPDGKLLSTVYTPSLRPEKGVCVVWNLAERTSLRQFDIGGPSTAFAPDSHSIAIVEPKARSVAITEIATGTLRRRFAVATSGPQCFAFDASGRQFALHVADESVTIFDVETGTPTAALDCEGHIHTLAWRSDGRMLA